MRRLARWSIALVVALAAPLAAQRTDVIRGRIIGPDSQPVADVNVKATSYTGGVTKTAKTDKRGQFNLVFVNGEGDYWIDLAKVGLTARRFEVRRIGDEEVLLANARMTDATAKLGAVEVTGQRDRKIPDRNATQADVGGGDRALAGGAVAPDQEGNLAAMAAGLAGFQMIPGLDGAADAFSALGLSGDQNNTTFAGLGSGISSLPPDILATTSINPYPFDVSLGGFSGAQITIQTIPGTNFSRRAITAAAIAPTLEWGTTSALAQGQRYANVRVGGNAAGPIVVDKAFYNVAYNVQRRASDFQTLTNTSALGLAAAGVAADSASRLLSILGRQGVVLDRFAPSSQRTTDLAQLSGNVDVSPSGSGAGHSFTLGGAANYQRTQPISRGVPLLTTPSHAGEASLWGANGTIAHANYFGFGVLSKTTLGVAVSGTRSSAFAPIPEGSVRVSSSLGDGAVSVKPLLFGGASSASSTDNHAVQITNQLTWYTEYNKHAFKIGSSLIRDDFSIDATPSLLGSYAYNSLADLEAGRPAAFTRTIGAARQTGTQLAGALSIGDAWRPSDGVQIQYGVRADANRFLSHPGSNDGLASALGVANDVVPNRVYLSPRIGMQWYYGAAPEVALVGGGVRPPRAVIHAGVGVFQNVSSAALVSGAMAATGLPASARTITCVGDAVPVADWNAFAASVDSIPDRCADGSAGSAFAVASPNVTYFDRSYRQPRSVRGAADWSGPILDNRFVLGLQTILSSGRSQSGLVDVNLDPTVRFTLAGEGSRPVYVDPSAIVPATGAVSIGGNRRAPAFLHVWETRSSYVVRSNQFTINLKPITANPWTRWEATYSLLDARETFSGFTSTAGNPFDVGAGPSSLAGRHTVMLRWYDVPVFDIAYVTLFARLTSGQRFTPMIAGDVNGDGMANDRAFVEDSPAIRSLMQGASSRVRECLMRQLNLVAARGSCAAPWLINSAVQVKLDPRRVGLPKRATLMLTMQNPVGLADLALHGSDNLRGWGQDIAPDQNLLFVRGFDPATRRFSYDVNQRFGSTRPQQAASYSLPFISLTLSIDVGVPRERQQLTQALDVGRRQPGNKAPALALAGFGLRSIPNPIGLILGQSDSLGLSRAQADSLAQLNRAFVTYAESLWIPVGRALAELPERYDAGDAFASYADARAQTVDQLIALLPSVNGILTSEQRRRLPSTITNYLDARVLRFLRTSTVGDPSSVIRR